MWFLASCAAHRPPVERVPNTAPQPSIEASVESVWSGLSRINKHYKKRWRYSPTIQVSRQPGAKAWLSYQNSTDSHVRQLICCVRGIDSIRAHSEPREKMTLSSQLHVPNAVCSPVSFSWVSLIVISTEFSMKPKNSSRCVWSATWTESILSTHPRPHTLGMFSPLSTCHQDMRLTHGLLSVFT